MTLTVFSMSSSLAGSRNGTHYLLVGIKVLIFKGTLIGLSTASRLQWFLDPHDEGSQAESLGRLGQRFTDGLNGLLFHLVRKCIAIETFATRPAS